MFTEGHWRRNIESQNSIDNQKNFSNNDNIYHSAISESRVSPISGKKFLVKRKPVSYIQPGYVETDADTHSLNLKFHKTLQTCDTGCPTYIDEITSMRTPQMSQSRYYLKQSLQNASLCSTFSSSINQPDPDNSKNLKPNAKSSPHDTPILAISRRSLQVSRQAPSNNLIVKSGNCNQRKNLFLRDATIFWHEPATVLTNTKISYLDKDLLNDTHLQTNHALSFGSKCDQSIDFNTFTGYNEYVTSLSSFKQSSAKSLASTSVSFIPSSHPSITSVAVPLPFKYSILSGILRKLFLSTILLVLLTIILDASTQASLNSSSQTLDPFLQFNSIQPSSELNLHPPITDFNQQLAPYTSLSQQNDTIPLALSQYSSRKRFKAYKNNDGIIFFNIPHRQRPTDNQPVLKKLFFQVLILFAIPITGILNQLPKNIQNLLKNAFGTLEKAAEGLVIFTGLFFITPHLFRFFGSIFFNNDGVLDYLFTFMFFWIKQIGVVGVCSTLSYMFLFVQFNYNKK